MIAIFNKEFRSYFTSAVGYIFMAVFLLITGIFFALINLLPASSYYNSVLQNSTFVFLILVPMLTMRTLAEEKHQKTDQLLLTSPLKISDIVLGKYFAAIVLFLLTLVITCLFPLILSLFGEVSTWEIVGNYIGFFLMGAAFISIGLFISALTESQIASAFTTLGVLLITWLIEPIKQGLPSSLSSGVIFAGLLVLGISAIIYNATKNIYAGIIIAILGGIAMAILYFVQKTLYEGFATKFLSWFSLLSRYDSFAMGMLDISSIVYYITFSAAFVFLTIRMIEKRRWN